MPRDSHFGIAVGIDAYPQLRPLTSAVKDATEFCEWLMSSQGGDLPEDNVALIASPPNPPADPLVATPTQVQIDQALRDFGAENGERIGERLYFYFAGHGFGPSFDDVGMLMANAALNRLKYNIGLRPYRDYFHETKLFDEVVYILDCCRDRDFSAPTAPPVFDKTRVPNNNLVADFVLMASAYGEKAFAPVDQVANERRGLLTTALLEGLKGDSVAVDSQGRITAASLRDYIANRILELADNSGVVQTADIPPPATEFIFRTVGVASVPRLKVHIVAPAEISGELVLRHGTNDEVLEQRAADLARAANPWIVDLPINSRYTVEIKMSDLGIVLDPAKAKQEPYVFQLPRP